MDWFLHGKDLRHKRVDRRWKLLYRGTESKNYFQNEGWSYRGMTLKQRR